MLTRAMRTSALGVVLAGFCGVAWSAEEIDLPATLAWTAYDVGSAGYNQSVAIGNAFKNAYGIDLRVLPGKNDVSRTIPLREGKVHFSATGVGASFFAQEGMFEFGARDWGPQPARLLLTSLSDANLTVGVAADAGIETLADLKGKRVAWIAGAPALNENVKAMLAFADLTWDDVEKVEFSGFGASWEGIINDQVDAAFAVTTSGPAYQLESSPRGLHWPPLPHDDKEGWARLTANAPFFVPNLGTEGAGLSKDNPHEGAAYPYPILIAYADQDPDLVYNMTKAMVEQFDNYKDGAPGAGGWALERQQFDWVVPYHEGAIRYLEEIGVWTEAFQEQNDRLIERQEVLQAAWQEYTSGGPSDDEEAFYQGWLEARAEALEAAGFDPIWKA
jgi:TRAP transporter TAXI family solute receptor